MSSVGSVFVKNFRTQFWVHLLVTRRNCFNLFDCSFFYHNFHPGHCPVDTVPVSLVIRKSTKSLVVKSLSVFYESLPLLVRLAKCGKHHELPLPTNLGHTDQVTRTHAGHAPPLAQLSSHQPQSGRVSGQARVPHPQHFCLFPAQRFLFQVTLLIKGGGSLAAAL